MVDAASPTAAAAPTRAATAAAAPAASASSQPGAAEIAVGGAHSLSFRELLSDMNPLQYVPVVGTIYRAVTGDVVPESVRTIGSFVTSGLLSGPIGLATTAGTLLLERLTGIDPEQIGQSLLARLGIGGHAKASAPASLADSSLAAQPGAAPALPAGTASPPNRAPAATTPPGPATLAAAAARSDAAPGPAATGGAAEPGPGSATMAGAAEPGRPGGTSAAQVAASQAEAAGSAPAAGTRRAWTTAQLSAYGVTRDRSGALRRGSLSGSDVLNSLELGRIAGGGADGAAAA